MKEKRQGWVKHIDFVILDILILELSYLAACAIRFGYKNLIYDSMYENTLVIFLVLGLLEGTFTKNYKNILKRGRIEELMSVLKHTFGIMLCFIVYLFFKKYSVSYSRSILIMTTIFVLVLTYLLRQIWKRVVKKIFKAFNRGKSSLIIISTSGELEEIIACFKKNIDTMYRVRGAIVVDKNMSGTKVDGIEVVAGRTDAVDFLCRDWVDEAFVSLPAEYEEFSQMIINECIIMGVTVKQSIAKKYETPGCKQTVHKMGNYTVLTSSVNLVTASDIFLKRTLDILGGIVGLIITGILYVFVAPMIYFKSPGPIFFKQWRVGKNGKKFQIYKFRSMYMDAEERKKELMAQNKVKDGMMFKIDNDPRIIGGEKGKGIGNFIRNTSIDEFPQFLNVLKGDMSLVGTRPPTIDEWERYQSHHRKRMAIKPGLTGMWQISGRSDITDFEEVVRLDTEYITDWSIKKDIVILLKTVKVVLAGKGSC